MQQQLRLHRHQWRRQRRRLCSVRQRCQTGRLPVARHSNSCEAARQGSISGMQQQPLSQPCGPAAEPSRQQQRRRRLQWQRQQEQRLQQSLQQRQQQNSGRTSHRRPSRLWWLLRLPWQLKSRRRHRQQLLLWQAERPLVAACRKLSRSAKHPRSRCGARITPPTAGTAKRARWTVGQVGVQQAPAASWRISCRRHRHTCRRSSRHHPRTDRAGGLPRGARRGPRLRQGAHLWRKPTSAESSVCDLSQLSHATHVILPTYRSRQLLIVISMHWHTGTMMQQGSICSRELTSFCYMSEGVWNVVHRGAKETDRRRRRRG